MEIVELPFGPEGKDVLLMELGVLGRERYYVNQALAYRHWSLVPRGLRQFRHGPHQFAIQVCVGLRAIEGSVHVDGQILSNDPFSGFNARLAQRRRNRQERHSARAGFGQQFGRLFVWLSCFLLAFALMKACWG